MSEALSRRGILGLAGALGPGCADRELQETPDDQGGILARGHPGFTVAISSKVHGVKAVPPNTPTFIGPL